MHLRTFRTFLFVFLGLSSLFLSGFLGFYLGRVHTSLDETRKPEVCSLAQDENRSSSVFSYLRLANVRFRWTESRYIETQSLTVKAIPYNGYSVLNLDQPDSFYLYVLNGDVSLKFSVLEEIFNDTVFRYQGSPLRKIRLSFVKAGDEPGIRLEGEMKLGIWIGFQMDCKIRVEKNRILLVPVRISALGLPFVKGALDLIRLHLETLLPIPKGRGAELEGSVVVIDPFRLFRSPAIAGKLHSAKVEESGVIVGFQNAIKPIPPTSSSGVSKNFIFLWKGNVQFGKLIMRDANILMVDSNPKNLFDFYLAKYERSLVRGRARIREDRSVQVEMPDFF